MKHEHDANVSEMLAEIARLTRQDEVHWKTRRTLLAEHDRYRAALVSARDLLAADDMISTWQALKGINETLSGSVPTGESR
jgi:hypothetical protein